MGRLVAGMASSHAFALSEPEGWDAGRARNRDGYARRYGQPPPEHPRVADETDDDIRQRQPRIAAALADLRQRLAALRPDALILVGDDQDENLTADNLPQMAVYVGGPFLASQQGGADSQRHPAATDLAATILDVGVQSDVDLASLGAFPDDRLRAHAFGPILRLVDPAARIPVVLVFVNSIHLPAPSPARCYYLGQTVRRAVEACAAVDRVAIYASGGLSHFTAGYPWRHYRGPHGYGAIDEAFDHGLLASLAAGEGRALASLSSADLLEHGDVEFRSWLTLLGAIGDVPPALLVYEPFYRAIMGMGVAAWDLAD
jgi:hypothetical protein